MIYKDIIEKTCLYVIDIYINCSLYTISTYILLYILRYCEETMCKYHEYIENIQSIQVSSLIIWYIKILLRNHE